MKRRDFIRKTIPGAVLPFVLNGLPIQVFGQSPLLDLIASASGVEDHVLVLVQLNGGNDGLNTVIPVDQYSNLSKARANILIPSNKVLALTGTQATGFHPAMSQMRDMYNNGLMSVIQGVGYPNPNYSHFRSTDIWLSASDANQFISSGWLGRFLDGEYPGFPTGYPNTGAPDPPAIQVGSVVSPALQGPEVSMGMAITDPNSFYQFLNGTVDPAPNTPAGHELTYVRLVAQQTQQYSGSIKTAAGKATNQSSLYPNTGQNSLADQLKIVAQLIAGGLKTKIYMVSMGGFDTHSAQTDNTDPSIGAHATLLTKLSVAINAFQDDLKLLGVQDRVLGMTFSEFGRRIQSNASLGTDHGSAAPLFVFGSQVKAGFIGSNPTIPGTVTVNDNLPMQYDFRSVYATILRDWFGLPQNKLDSIMMQPFPYLPFVNGSVSSNEMEEKAARITLIENYPNPFKDHTWLRFSSNGGLIRILLYNNNGQEIAVLAEQQRYAPGTHEIPLNLCHLPAGTYYVRLQSGAEQRMCTLLLQRD